MNGFFKSSLDSLQQKGSHGSAYYKRYPKQFEKFTPTCETKQLEQFSQEGISNTYDNALLYADHFLSKTTKLLKTNDNKFESTLFYVSGHGESLGENNLYLHGLPYMITAKEQTHVLMIMWFSDSFDKTEINFSQLKQKAHKELSHDNVFHTIQGLMKFQSDIYDESMDVIEHEDDD